MVENLYAIVSSARALANLSVVDIEMTSQGFLFGGKRRQRDLALLYIFVPLLNIPRNDHTAFQLEESAKNIYRCFLIA